MTVLMAPQEHVLNCDVQGNEQKKKIKISKNIIYKSVLCLFHAFLISLKHCQ